MLFRSEQCCSDAQRDTEQPWEIDGRETGSSHFQLQQGDHLDPGSRKPLRLVQEDACVL